MHTHTVFVASERFRLENICAREKNEKRKSWKESDKESERESRKQTQ